MTDDQEKDLSAESENPEEEVASAENSDPAVDGDEPAAEAEAEDASQADGEVAAAEGEDASQAAEVAVAEDEADVSEADAAPDEPGTADQPDEGEAEAGEADDGGKVVNEADASEDDAEAAMLEMLEGLPDEDDKASPDDINFGAASASRAEFQHLQEPVTPPESRNIDLLMDVDLPISIELGRTKMPIADILALGPGAVVELNKLAGEPVDLLVNHKVVARGEVVVVDENFGLRITQLMTPEERLKALAQE